MFYKSVPLNLKIRIPNYLIGLVDETDGKGNSLYITGASEFIENIWNEITEKNRKLNVRQLIPKIFGVTTATFYSYRTGKKSISIQNLYNLIKLWAEICNKKFNELEEKWNEFYLSYDYYFVTHNKCQKVRLPRQITPNLSYLIGWLCGDGHFKQSHNYIVKISEKSQSQLKQVLKPLIKELFGIDVPIFRRYMNGYAIQFGSKSIYRFFKKILKINVGEIPDFIKSLDKINKRYFLMGVFDSEGCVLRSRNRISIAQSKKDFLIQIMKLMEELGVRFQKPTFHKTKLGEWYSIRLGSKKDFIAFSERVGSYHVDKKILLQKWVDKIKNGGDYQFLLTLSFNPNMNNVPSKIKTEHI